MLNNKTIAAVIPVFNEEAQIEAVLNSIPDFVDKIVVINDCSTDSTEKVVLNFFARYKHQVTRFVLLTHEKNSGKGAGIKTGYRYCKMQHIDCVATLDGDGQMNLDELEGICNPVVFEEVDYVKGNRLIHESAWRVIPKVRIFGNIILSLLTKPCSGYWRVSDTQTGYTAMSKKALHSIDIDSIYTSYGYPNDVLVKLNIGNCTIREVETRPIYHADAKSKMNIFGVIPRISWLLIKSFFRRVWIKYKLQKFSFIFICYHLAFMLGLLSCFFAVALMWNYFRMQQIETTLLHYFFLTAILSISVLIPGIFLDIRENEKLYK